jgi:hypothetical protein
MADQNETPVRGLRGRALDAVARRPMGAMQATRQFTTATPRRFCDQAASFEPFTAGRSLP